MERAIDALKRTGLKINEQLLSHMSPLGWEHINLTGDYIWKSNRIPASGKFSRLRPAKVERSKKTLTYNNFLYPNGPLIHRRVGNRWCLNLIGPQLFAGLYRVSAHFGVQDGYFYQN